MAQCWSIVRRFPRHGINAFGPPFFIFALSVLALSFHLGLPHPQDHLYLLMQIGIDVMLLASALINLWWIVRRVRPNPAEGCDYALPEKLDLDNETALTKNELLAYTCHEIRNFIGCLFGFAQLLGETTLNQNQREMVDTINASADGILVILNDILDLSKIEPRKLMDEVIHLVTPQAAKKNLVLHLHFNGELPVYCFSDPFRVRQILSNLLGNAVKFTSTGSVELTASMDGSYLFLEIRDSGIGISPEIQASLFQNFFQGDASISRKFGGTGLGLVISKHLAELLGGEIGFESEKGKGSYFWVKIPVEVGAQITPDKH